jgi:hypothetical protein
MEQYQHTQNHRQDGCRTRNSRREVPDDHDSDGIRENPSKLDIPRPVPLAS